MVPDLRMHQFVCDHVVDHLQRSLHQPPGETERSSGTARSPARTGGRDAHLSISEFIPFRVNENPLRDHRQRLYLVPMHEDPPGFRKTGICQPELAAAESERGPLRRNDGQWICFSEEKKGFSLNVALYGRGSRCLKLGLFPVDPLRMLFDEFLDGTLSHPQRSAYHHAAIPLDDERDRPPPGADELVNNYGHAKKYTKAGGCSNL